MEESKTDIDLNLEWLKQLENGELVSTNLSSEQKLYLGKLVHDDKIKTVEAANKYHIPKGSVSRFHKYYTQRPDVPVAAGRPRSLGPEEEEELIHFLQQDPKYKKSSQSFKLKIAELVDLWCKKRGKGFCSGELSPNTIRNIEERLAIRTGKCRADNPRSSSCLIK
jgi:hypothetical protein